MAFPTNLSLTKREALAQIVQAAAIMRAQSQAINSRSAAGAIPSTEVAVYADSMAELFGRIKTLKDTPGLAAYAKSEYGDAQDIVADFNAMESAVTALVTWIVQNFPKAANGNIEERSFSAQGRLVNVTLSTAALSEFRTRVAAFVATTAG